MSNLIIFGGTFDPVHNGHLKTAQAVQHFFHFNRFLFLPCKIQVLKNKTNASSTQRIEMLNMALKAHPDFSIDLREIERDTPSYMVETLHGFRNEFKQTAMTLLIGMDTFMQLPRWYHWEELLDLTHLLVINRVGIDEQNMPDSLQQLLSRHETFNNDALLNHRSGKIYRYDAGHYNISSSWIRQQIKAGHDMTDYLPAGVYEYIKEQRVY